ncbi:MAG: GC-type dockerin domain-anchored protein [Phycisphaerales bacterium JB058]
MGESGRVILDASVDTSSFTITPDAQVLSGTGPAASNPFIAVSSPLIPSLVGGADAYGLTGNDATQSAMTLLDDQFDSLVSGSGIGIAILDDATFLAGPGVDFAGFDLLLVFNISSVDIGVTELGLDGAASQLLVGGYANNPRFGGAGPQSLGSLLSQEVYATLIPEVGTFEMGLSYREPLDPDTVTEASLDEGDFAGFSGGRFTFLNVVTETCLADVNGDGFVTPADFSAWVSAFNTMSPQCDQNSDGMCTPADFSAWVDNYNAGCD